MIRNIELVLCKNKELNMHIVPNWIVYSFSVLIYNLLWVMFPGYLFGALSNKQLDSMLYVAIIAICCMVAVFLRSYLKNSAWMKINRIRYACLSDILRFSLEIPYEKYFSSDYIDLLNVTKMAAMNPEIGIGKIMVCLYDFMGLLVSVLGLLWILSEVSFWFILIMLVLIVIEICIQSNLTKFEISIRKSKNVILSKFEKINDMTMSYDMAKEIRFFSLANVSGYYSEDYSNIIGDYEDTEVKKTEAKKLLLNFCRVLRMIIIYLYMISAARSGMIATSMILTYVLCSLNLANSINSLIAIVLSIRKEAHSFDGYWKLKECLDENRFFQVASDQLHDQVSIVFHNVSYTYPGATVPALKNVSFEIKKGERVALLGKNGSGKSTCIKLLCGLLTPQSGEILINGKNIQEYSMEKYAEVIRCVLQDGVLFPYTIKENVSMSDSSNLEKVRAAVDGAIVNDFIKEKPDKYDTIISKALDSNGIEVSGGEKQGLLLARAIYRKSGKLFLLDEPAGALDPFAEDTIYKRYEELTQNTTSIIVAHQLQFTPKCDLIIFLKDGVVSEMGNHQELIRKQSDYYTMYEAQKEKYKNA